MRNLSESVDRIRLDIFKLSNPDLLKPTESIVASLCEVFNKDKDSNKKAATVLAKLESTLTDVKFREKFNSFNQTHGTNSELWNYWNIFLDKIMPTVIDLTRSFREADWQLHLSAIRRAMPLLFAFGRKIPLH